jgi:hypothetical protein
VVAVAVEIPPVPAVPVERAVRPVALAAEAVRPSTARTPVPVARARAAKSA